MRGDVVGRYKFRCACVVGSYFPNIQRKAGLTQNFVTGHVVGLGFSGAAAGVEGVLAGVSRVTKEFNTRLVAPGETRMSMALNLMK